MRIRVRYVRTPGPTRVRWNPRARTLTILATDRRVYDALNETARRFGWRLPDLATLLQHVRRQMEFARLIPRPCHPQFANDYLTRGVA